MPHFWYDSGLLRASANPRSSSLACARPPTSSKDTLGWMSVSTRPVRSPNFSPSLEKTSSSRRCSAQCRSSSGKREAISDVRARLARSLVEDAVLDQHRDLGAQRQRDRVGRTRVEREIVAGAAAEVHGGV